MAGWHRGFFRLFGDINGDRQVSLIDFGRFSRAFATSAGTEHFVEAFDVNGDGTIRFTVFVAFLARFGLEPPVP